MFIGIAMFFILMLMGGIIAFLGDKIGSKVGKKRLTLFGLRPRYTSVIVTIISGVLISFLTIAVLAVLNENVRVALFGLSKLRTEMSDLNSQIAGKNQELASGKQLLDQRTQEYNDMNRKAQGITQELEQTEQQKNYMQTQLQVVQNAYDQAQKDINASAEEIQQLEQTRKELNENIKRLDEEKTDLITNITAIREGTVLFRAGQIISSAVVDENMSRDDAAHVLASILNDTNTTLREKLNVQDENAVIVRVTQDAFNQAVEQIKQSPKKKLIRIEAAGNIIVGEPAFVTFEIHDNNLVFKKGEAIFSADMDQYEKYKNDDLKVLHFLKDLNRYATEHGVLPDPITGNVGQLDGQELMETIQKVKALNGRCILTAVAKQDIYTQGPVTIDVQITGKEKT